MKQVLSERFCKMYIQIGKTGKSGVLREALKSPYQCWKEPAQIWHNIQNVIQVIKIKTPKAPEVQEDIDALVSCCSRNHPHAINMNIVKLLMAALRTKSNTTGLAQVEDQVPDNVFKKFPKIKHCKFKERSEMHIKGSVKIISIGTVH